MKAVAAIRIHGDLAVRIKRTVDAVSLRFYEDTRMCPLFVRHTVGVNGLKLAGDSRRTGVDARVAARIDAAAIVSLRPQQYDTFVALANDYLKILAVVLVSIVKPNREV